jgi:hypothetical protein
MFLLIVSLSWAYCGNMVIIARECFMISTSTWLLSLGPYREAGIYQPHFMDEETGLRNSPDPRTSY